MLLAAALLIMLGVLLAIIGFTAIRRPQKRDHI
jgi:hypothetical protein